MKIKFNLVLICLELGEIYSQQIQNKSKRGLTDFGDANFKPVYLYSDNIAASVQAPQRVSAYYVPKYIAPVKEPKVTTQQVLYEYQETPHNTVSNVHVNQQFQNVQQPVAESTQLAYTQYLHQPSSTDQYRQPQNHQYQHQYQHPQGNPYVSETVANPVQHSSIIQHAPYIPNPQNNPYLMGKYLYLNGKVIYNASPAPQHPLQQTSQQFHPSQQYHPLQQPHTLQQPHSLPQHHSSQQPHPSQRHHPSQQPHPTQRPKPKYPNKAPQSHPAVSYQNYQQFRPTTLRPVEQQKEDVKEVHEEVEEAEAEEDDKEKEEINEEDDDEASNEEDDHEGYKNDDEHFGRYSFDDDDEDDGDHHKRYKENDDHEHYKEDDEDENEDSDRDSSSSYFHKKEPKSNQNKYHSSYKYKNKMNVMKKMPKKPYQTIRYSQGSNGNPKIEYIQGKSSQQIPITVQKVYREKWFITKNTKGNH